jgi:hypothetical protein
MRIRSAAGAVLVLSLALSGLFSGPKTPRGEDCPTLAGDGAWCWFADPRAVRVKIPSQKIFAGWVDSAGSVWAGSLDPKTGQVAAKILHDRFDKDDHAAPALLPLPNGRLAVFYSAHGGTQDQGMRYRISANAGDVLAWSEEFSLDTNTGGPRGYCYPNPVRLEKENGRVYLFWRGGNFKPTMSWTDDLKSWAPARTLIASDEDANVRPYTKLDSNGTDRIHIAFTDGHPRNVPANSIYYACYRNGALYKAGGQKIKDLSSLPLAHREADLVYDAKRTGIRAWIWDVAADRKNRPVIVYTRLPSENDHRYQYARWTGEVWEDHEICPAGPWFPQTPEGKAEPEPHYSGGVVLDHADPTVVYLSRRVGAIFEIERRQTRDGGRTWTSEAVTANSTRDNVRPFVIRDHSKNGPAVLWMSITMYRHYTDYRATLKMSR